jgi:hypothetical protein
MLFAQPSLQFADNLGIPPVRILLKGSGSVVVGSTVTGGMPLVQFRQLRWRQLSIDTDNPEKPSDVARNGIDTPLDDAFDSGGNLWIVGSTRSDDFTLVNLIVTTKVPYR